MEPENKDLKSIKEKRKEESKLAGKYLKAKFNSKIGYRFTAVRYYIQHNKEKLTKRFNIVFSIIIFALLISSLVLYVSGKDYAKETAYYSEKYKGIQSDLENVSDTVDEQESTIEEFSISTESDVVRASNLLTKLFKGMYNYKNAEEYEENRNKAMNLFSNPNDDWIGNVYSDDIDSDGSSIIENLSLTSEIINMEMYSKDIDDITNKTLKINALIRYQSYIDGISSDYSTRTHEALYEVEINANTRKITNAEKVNTVKVLNNIE